MPWTVLLTHHGAPVHGVCARHLNSKPSWKLPSDGSAMSVQII
jgi:hypothetical protein